MCDFFSAVITHDGRVFHHPHNSHSGIVAHYGLTENDIVSKMRDAPRFYEFEYKLSQILAQDYGPANFVPALYLRQYDHRVPKQVLQAAEVLWKDLRRAFIDPGWGLLDAGSFASEEFSDVRFAVMTNHPKGAFVPGVWKRLMQTSLTMPPTVSPRYWHHEVVLASLPNESKSVKLVLGDNTGATRYVDETAADQLEADDVLSVKLPRWARSVSIHKHQGALRNACKVRVVCPSRLQEVSVECENAATATVMLNGVKTVTESLRLSATSSSSAVVELPHLRAVDGKLVLEGCLKAEAPQVTRVRNLNMVSLWDLVNPTQRLEMPSCAVHDIKTVSSGVRSQLELKDGATFRAPAWDNINNYTPRRAAKRWLENAPAEVLDIFYQRKIAAWSVLLGGFFLSPQRGRTRTNCIVAGIELNAHSNQPNGLCMSFELSSSNAVDYRAGSKHRRVTWDSLPPEVKKSIEHHITYWRKQHDAEGS